MFRKKKGRRRKNLIKYDWFFMIVIINRKNFRLKNFYWLYDNWVERKKDEGMFIVFYNCFRKDKGVIRYVFYIIVFL